MASSTPSQEPAPGNPNPNKRTLLRHREFGEYLVLEIQYPDCTNFEGRKVLVFKCGLEAIRKQKAIDPHFSDKKDMLYPIARFRPTREGWKDACDYALAKSMK